MKLERDILERVATEFNLPQGVVERLFNDYVAEITYMISHTDLDAPMHNYRIPKIGTIVSKPEGVINFIRERDRRYKNKGDKDTE